MKDDDLTWLPLLLQTADALFPTGAYAHSLGFEEAVRLGVVRDAASLRTFLIEQIAPAQRRQELPYLRFAFEAAVIGERCALDAEIDAWKLAGEQRAASAQLGMRRLKAVRTICAAEELGEFERAIGDGRAIGHHLVVFALQARVMHLPLRAALAAWYYQSLAAVCAAALKLIRIGQDGCQRALRDAASLTQTAIDESLTIQRDDAGWFTPMLEIASMRHARADERLFIS